MAVTTGTAPERKAMVLDGAAHILAALRNVEPEYRLDALAITIRVYIDQGW
jgi:hypothetical protein